MKYYLLTYNPATIDSQEIKQFIDSKVAITDWWHYADWAYIVESDLPMKDIHADFVNQFKHINFLIVPIEPSQSNGYLPLTAWDWLNAKKSS